MRVLSVRRKDLINLSFSSAKRGSFSTLLVAAGPAEGHSPVVGGFTALRMGVALEGKTAFSFVGKREVFILQLVFACPAGAKTAFSFAVQKKKRFWTPKKKR